VRFTGKVNLDGYAKGYVCATSEFKVTNYPTNHQSADRCQQCQVHYRKTVMANIVCHSMNMLELLFNVVTKFATVYAYANILCACYYTSNELNNTSFVRAGIQRNAIFCQVK